jgi:RNA polymerase-binding transcription factor DksA
LNAAAAPRIVPPRHTDRATAAHRGDGEITWKSQILAIPDRFILISARGTVLAFGWGTERRVTMKKAHLTAAECRRYRETLQNLEARLTGKVSQLEAEALRPAATPSANPDEVPAHEAEPASRVSDDIVSLSVLGSEEQILAETRAALARIDAGTFGTCEACGHPISHARLDAVPYARDCIRCARTADTPD